jgi:hypothetical protein
VLIARDLAPESHGNGVGIGLADIVTRGLMDKIDWRVTNTNVWTSGFLERSKAGIVAADDAEALEIARYLLRDVKPESLRVVRIPDTLHLSEIQVSEALLPEVLSARNLDLQPGEDRLPGAE